MTDMLVDGPGSPPILEVSIWIGHNQDGTESVMVVDLDIVPGITRHMPLMATRRDLAEKFREIAEHVMKLSRHASTEIVRLELRTFKAMDQS